MICYIVLAIILFIFGFICYSKANSLHDLLVRYDDICLDEKVCRVLITPTHDLINPKLYY